MAGARKDFVLRKALTIEDKFFNVLITDSQTATRLLKNPNALNHRNGPDGKSERTERVR
jgi:hypothetical protein